MASPRFRPGGWSPTGGTLALALFLLLAPASLGAQTAAHDVQGQVFAGSGLEGYLRVLQATGEVPLYPWSIRGFGAREVERIAPRDSLHPWARRYSFAPDSAPGPHFEWIRPRARLILNTGFPYGYNDGPVWAGRGLTAALDGGFAARWGPVSLAVDPLLFRSANRHFTLAAVEPPASPYASARSSATIDLPQRFGDDAYGRLDPGESTLRVDLGPVSVGASTATQVWGPAWDQPLILGTNAAGFPHAFLGSSHPLNIGIGRLHGRLTWGRLDESPYAPPSSYSGRTLMSGLVAVFVPRGLDGLEIGGARFFHSPWPADGPGWSDFTRPFQSVLKVGLSEEGRTRDRSDPDNQLASAFARWVFPASGFEVYGEYAREDHNWNLRDLIMEPDHDSGYTIGFARVWRAEGSRYVALRGEVMNTQVTKLDEVRNQTPFYEHSKLHQGHTQRGQILGAAYGFGGGSARIQVEGYDPRGGWSLGLARHLVDQFASGGDLDVMYSADAELRLFLGRFDLTAGITPVYELNRDPVGDAFNLNTSLGLRAVL